MKAKEVKEMSVSELNLKLGQLKEELFNLRFSHATGALNDTTQLSKCKKDIARVLTVLSERECQSGK